MLLEIDDNKRVSDLKDKFNECFPYLKIEFYHWGYKWHSTTAKNNLINPFSLVENIRTRHEPGILQIRSSDKIEKVQREFKEGFGLNVQVFCLQGGAWVATNDKEELTIRELMTLAEEEAVKKSNQQPTDEEDSYDLRPSI